MPTRLGVQGLQGEGWSLPLGSSVLTEEVDGEAGELP